MKIARLVKIFFKPLFFKILNKKGISIMIFWIEMFKKRKKRKFQMFKSKILYNRKVTKKLKNLIQMVM
jgi:hypothetical protein